jgi:hypothetical protein
VKVAGKLNFLRFNFISFMPIISVLLLIILFLTGLKNPYDPPSLDKFKGKSMPYVGAWQRAKPKARWVWH